MLEMSTHLPEPNFTHFPHLPTELRLKIWGHFLILTLPSPLSITLKTQKWVADNSVLRKGKPIPAVLHVCRESREVGLGKYVLGYELEGGLSELPFNHCWKMVVDEDEES